MIGRGSHTHKANELSVEALTLLRHAVVCIKSALLHVALPVAGAVADPEEGTALTATFLAGRRGFGGGSDACLQLFRRVVLAVAEVVLAEPGVALSVAGAVAELGVGTCA